MVNNKGINNMVEGYNSDLNTKLNFKKPKMII